MNNIDYSKSSYKLENRGLPKKYRLDLGENSFSSKKDYLEERSKQVKNGKILSVDTIAFNNYYNVLWGLPNVLHINEHVKLRMEENNIRGINIQKMSNVKFQMPGFQ